MFLTLLLSAIAVGSVSANDAERNPSNFNLSVKYGGNVLVVSDRVPGAPVPPPCNCIPNFDGKRPPKEVHRPGCHHHKPKGHHPKPHGAKCECKKHNCKYGDKRDGKPHGMHGGKPNGRPNVKPGDCPGGKPHGDGNRPPMPPKGHNPRK